MADADMSERGKRMRAVLGTAVFLVVAPGVVGGLVPALITGWEADGPVPVWLAAAGWIAVGAGVLALLGSFARFALQGLGTPSPTAPTERLVVDGLYRRVRNPMYVAVGSIILGQAAILSSPGLVAYAAVFAAAVLGFVKLYEEPVLRARYGAQYDEYAEAVPAWRPRLRAWDPLPLRPARAEDAPAIRDLVEAAYGHYVEEIGVTPKPLTADYDEVVRTRAVALIGSGDGIAGLIVHGPDEEEYLIDNVAVAPRLQGRGIGTTLIAHAERAAAEGGFDSIRLYTHELMAENRRLYARLGYVEYGERPVESGRVILLRKPLA